MEFFDYDPETGEVATEAVKSRVKDGFNKLILSLQVASTPQQSLSRMIGPPVPIWFSDWWRHPDDWVRLDHFPWAVSKAMLKTIKGRAARPSGQ